MVVSYQPSLPNPRVVSAASSCDVPIILPMMARTCKQWEGFIHISWSWMVLAFFFLMFSVFACLCPKKTSQDLTRVPIMCPRVFPIFPSELPASRFDQPCQPEVQAQYLTKYSSSNSYPESPSRISVADSVARLDYQDEAGGVSQNRSCI